MLNAVSRPEKARSLSGLCDRGDIGLLERIAKDPCAPRVAGGTGAGEIAGLEAEARAREEEVEELVGEVSF